MQTSMLARMPRLFSPSRLTSQARRQLRLLGLTDADAAYAFLYGARIRRRGRLYIALRRCDMPWPDRSLDFVPKRDGILLELNATGWILSVTRDRLAHRKLRKRGGAVVSRTRNIRVR